MFIRVHLWLLAPASPHASRWLFGNFTDPQYKLSRRDQHRLSKAAHKKYLSWRRFWGYSLVVIGVPLGLAYRYGIPAVLGWLGLNGQTTAWDPEVQK